MATIEGRAFLLKEENKEIKTAFDLAQLCCMTESKDEFSSLLAGREVELELVVEVVCTLDYSNAVRHVIIFFGWGWQSCRTRCGVTINASVEGGGGSDFLWALR
jgi:hypothetical protein